MGRRRRRVAPPPPAAEIRFVRSPEARDRIYVQRPDGSSATWSFPSYGEQLPHDLVHLVVERRLGLRHGLWGRVCDGADLERINAMANRQGGPDKYRALGPDLRELMWSEALAAQPWLAEPSRPEAIVASLTESARTLEGFAVPGESAIEALRDELAQLRQQWRALAPKGTLVLHFDVAAPA